MEGVDSWPLELVSSWWCFRPAFRASRLTSRSTATRVMFTRRTHRRAGYVGIRARNRAANRSRMATTSFVGLCQTKSRAVTCQSPLPRGRRPPPTLWIEWRFRSNHPIGQNFFTCDGWVTLDYDQIHDVVFMYGDTAVSFSGADFVGGYAIEEFHTFRFESSDGVSFTVSVDGQVFMNASDNKSPGGAFVQIAGRGACDGFLNTVNEWDFVRYGTIATGETIIASDPPAGLIDPNDFPTLDRFTVTFDSANYVYIDDITVEVTGGIAPTLIQTLRRENTDPDTVEIVLDRPMPLNETTTFTITDGTATNVVAYTVRIPVPTVTTWGSVTMTLTLLVAATLIIKRM